MRPFGNIGQWMQSNSGLSEKTLLELLGQHRLVVEHHRGIVCYAEEEILIKTTYGLVSITGKELRLCRMSREQLCVRGDIFEIKLTGRGEIDAVEPNQRQHPG